MTHPAQNRIARVPLLSLFLLLTFLLSGIHARAEDPQARASLLTAKVVDGEISAYEFFTGISEGDQDKPLILQCDANEACTVLAFAWNDAEQNLHDGWAPVLRSMQSSEAIAIPEEPLAWSYSADSAPFSIYVAFLSNDDPACEQLETLTTAMAKEGLSEQIRSLQANQLKRIYDTWLAGKDQSEIKGRHTRASAAVSYRGTPKAASFAWQSGALTATFSDGSPGPLIFPVDAAE